MTIVVSTTQLCENVLESFELDSSVHSELNEFEIGVQIVCTWMVDYLPFPRRASVLQFSNIMLFESCTCQILNLNNSTINDTRIKQPMKTEPINY